MVGIAGLQHAAGYALPLLHDPQPIDLVISVCFLLACGLALTAGLVGGTPRSHRLRWTGVAALMGVLLLNQQGDFHVRVFAEARAAVRATPGLVPKDVILLVGMGAFALTFAILLGVVLVMATSTGPPGPWVAVGILLLLVHATIRLASAADWLPSPLTGESTHTLLKLAEIVGLVLIALAAHRYRRTPHRGRVPATAADDPAPGQALMADFPPRPRVVTDRAQP